MPRLPIPTDVNGQPYFASLDAAGNMSLPVQESPISSQLVSGEVTVIATAAEIFGGVSSLAKRRKMVLKNEDEILRFRIGGSTVTQQNGFPVEPGAVLELSFEPDVVTPIFAISEGAAVRVTVVEY